MALKKQTFADDEIKIFDDAIVYKRGNYWQFRVWLKNEGKYARFSLKTSNQSTAIDRAKLHYYEIMAQQHAGKCYFSLNCKAGVAKYLEQRAKDVVTGAIVKGRYGTIRTHLEHWLDFIGRDTKLKELERNACEDYGYERSKTKKRLAVSATTIANEQSTINAMIGWLFKQKEVHIDGFDFAKLKRVDKGDDALRRAVFTDDEIAAINIALDQCIAEGLKDIDDSSNLQKVVAAYYLMASIITGLRKGEQLQLLWKDVEFMERRVAGHDYSLIKIRVRAETSKVRRTRVFVVKDIECFENLWDLLYKRYAKANKDNHNAKHFGDTLVFSVDGVTQLTARAIGYHFDKVMERAEIDVQARDIVPYSFRHYFITQRINSNLTPTAVAEMCGTSVVQIQQTYYHTTEDKMITNAVADYYVKDGILRPV